MEQTLQECLDDILREIRQEERGEFGFVEENVRLKVDDIIKIMAFFHNKIRAVHNIHK